MDREELILGRENRIDDVRWLCSLTDSELDFLISLKVLIIQHAKKIGNEALAKKFDLKFLRALSFILMNKLNGQLKDISTTLSSSGSSLPLDDCNLLKFDLDESFDSLSIEELSAYVCSDKRKRIKSMLFEDIPPSQKQRTES
ncbi:PREDICTED: uncharacterized protein LOC109152360 [Ipomoea nil]|uniref:uncharacterized protein LOC109152360 n=1 Tax=Ipomoea nil TaxID=35883 RepID=UPI000901E939|nr:PREDICTED: uncharacterized protein LOC109152360 [Ipomoea nil]XP_019155548.1 PREDICTED: uncharacterized protein LOC109152360 [Ipomoea nil]